MAPQAFSALGFAAALPAPLDVSIANGQLAYAASASEAETFLDERTGDVHMPDIGTWDVWAEGSTGLFTNNVSESGNFGIAHFRSDYLVTEDVPLGLKMRLD